MHRFDLTIQRTDPEVVVQLVGELDIASVPVLQRGLCGIHALDPRPVVLDADGLRFIDARGVRGLHLAAASLRCHGHRVSTVNLRPNVRRVARLLGVEEHLGAD